MPFPAADLRRRLSSKKILGQSLMALSGAKPGRARSAVEAVARVP